MKPGDELVLTADELAYGGNAVGKADDGRVIFVPYLAPGDRARIRIESVKKGFARARALEIISGGPDRVPPACEVFGVCGGCQWQHVSIRAQRAAKERILRRLLEPFGLEGAVGAIQGGQKEYGYRNRLILPLRAQRGGLRAGFFRSNSHNLVDLSSCPVQHGSLWAAAWQVVSRMREMELPGYEEASGKGLLRHLVVRRAAGTGEIGVIVVASRRRASVLKPLAEHIMAARRDVSAFSVSVNNRRTNVVFGPRIYQLAGQRELNEELAGIKLQVPLGSFFQANVEVTSFMLETLRSWLEGERGGVLDLYCGVGIMGIAAAGGIKNANLTGIESDEAAVNAARRNAARHSNFRARFIAGEAGRILPRVRASLGDLRVIIVDPPRKGLSSQVLRHLLGLMARRLIYVSCDPVTFARDLKILLAAGYRLRKVVPMDMFPQTFHIELMADLSCH